MLHISCALVGALSGHESRAFSNAQGDLLTQFQSESPNQAFASTIECAMRFELTDLRVFMAIANARSLSAGAADVHLTAPSASYRLKNLERAMGAPLFERGPKGMALTPAGITVRRHAQMMLANAERLQAEMRQHANGAAGLLRVLANSSTLSQLPGVLSRFLTAYPNVNVDLEERLSEDIVKSVRDGNAEVGLIAGAIELRGLESIVYGHDELVFAAMAGHPLAAQETASLELALGYDLVTIGRKSSNFLYLQNLANQLGVSPRVRVHAPTFDAAIRFVREGVGIALMPRSIAWQATLSGRVVLIGVQEPWAQREQRVVIQNLNDLPDYAQAFVRFLQEGSPEINGV